MRRLAGEVAQLWVARRAELDHPLGVVDPLEPARAAAAVRPAPDEPRTLVFEIGTEELPPPSAPGAARTRSNGAHRAAGGDPAGARRRPACSATPRRLVAVVEAVAAPRGRSRPHASRARRCRRRTSADGAPDQGGRGVRPRAGRHGRRRGDGGGRRRYRHVVVQQARAGPPGARRARRRARAGRDRRCASAKNMRWNDPTLTFSRPIRWLTALWGDERRAGGRVHACRRAPRPGCCAPRRPTVAGASAETFLETAGGQRHRRRPGGPPRPDRRRRAGPGRRRAADRRRRRDAR